MKIKKDVDRNVIVNYTAVFSLILLVLVLLFTFFKYGCQKKESNKVDTKKKEEISKSIEEDNNEEEIKEPLNLEIMGAIIVDIDDLRNEVNNIANDFIKNDIVMPTAKKKIEAVKLVRDKYIKYLEDNNYNGKMKDMLISENIKDEKILELISNADRRGLEEILKKIRR